MKRKETKKKIKKCLKKIKELGFSFSRVSVSYDSCVFEISELPDFLWGIWMKRNYGINPAYFGDLKWFYDKFYPSRSPYSYTSFGEFLDNLGLLKENYKKEVIRIYSNTDKADDDIWAEFQRDSEEQKFIRTHYGLTKDEYQEALEEKEEFYKYLKGLDNVIDIEYEVNNLGVMFKIGNFTITCTSGEDELYDKMFGLKYNRIGRPNLYVGEDNDK